MKKHLVDYLKIYSLHDDFVDDFVDFILEKEPELSTKEIKIFFFAELKKIRLLLRNFLKTKSIRNQKAEEFSLVDTEDFTKDELINFFNSEKARVKKRDEDYENKRIRKTISFTNEEFSRIEHKIEDTKLDFSTYAKSILLEREINLADDLNKIYESNELDEKIRKIGTNINQITKHINMNKRIDTYAVAELSKINSYLEELKAEKIKNVT